MIETIKTQSHVHRISEWSRSEKNNRRKAGLLLKRLTMPNSMLYSKLDARFRDHAPNIGGVPVFGQMFCELF